LQLIINQRTETSNTTVLFILSVIISFQRVVTVHYGLVNLKQKQKRFCFKTVECYVHCFNSFVRHASLERPQLPQLIVAATTYRTQQQQQQQNNNDE